VIFFTAQKDTEPATAGANSDTAGYGGACFTYGGDTAGIALYGVYTAGYGGYGVAHIWHKLAWQVTKSKSSGIKHLARGKLPYYRAWHKLFL